MSPRKEARQPLPLWARWAAATVVGIAVIAAVVIAVNRAGPEGVAASESGAEAEVSRLSDLAITEDQAPRTANLPASSAPAAALRQAIVSDVHKRIAHDQLVGPLQSVHCAASAPSSDGPGGREPYLCTVHSDGISYRFLAVVDQRDRRLTWCKVDPPAAAKTGPEIPVSARCRD
jgi:hypothetical protein